MKKLFAGYSCVLFLQSFSHASVNQVTNPEKAAGQKLLIKAIAVIVNTEANKKTPAKVAHVFSSGDTSI
jgi:hypothetical protein